MVKKFNSEQVKKYWIQQALKCRQSPEASWSDQAAMKLEVREIMRYLEEGDKVLDIGCGNGYSTMQFAANKRIDILGLDYVPEMIEQANLRIKNPSCKLLGKIRFGIGDITSLGEKSGVYDKVIVIRTIINLGTWSLQLKGLKECARVLKPGGMLLLSEATLQGWRQLNKFRREFALPDIPVPPFNSYLDQGKLSKTFSLDLELSDVVDFSSTYYVGTRILKPLFIKLTKAKIDTADPDTEWNRWFSMLPSWGECGVQKLFIFRKI